MTDGDRHIMSLDEMREHEWIVSWSGGKDSTATIILMHENKIPIKKIVYVRMMFDETTPATLPIMTDFIEVGAAQFREWGYNVEIIPSIKTAMDLATAIYENSIHEEWNGKPYGINAFMRGICKFSGVKCNTVKKKINLNNEYQMIGYAADEVKRLHNLGGRKQSILCALNITTPQTFTACRRYGLLSPLYGTGVMRDGCFFCPNCKKRERDIIRQTRPDLIEKIYDLIRMSDYNNYFLKCRNYWLSDYYRELEEAADPFKQSTLSDF